MSEHKRSIQLATLEDDELIEQALNQLRTYCSKFRIIISDEALEQCVRHLLYVIQVNDYINLTRITDIKSALVLHILDSLTLLPYVPAVSEICLDMGTGAGFPGIPLACASSASWCLLDSVKKKVAVVQEIADELNLNNIETVHARVEEFARAKKFSFDLVVARAVAPLATLLEYSRPLLVKNGSLLVSKGIPSVEEFEQASHASRVLGYILEERIEFDLPDGYGHRTLFRYRVSRPSQVKLPRSVGQARKKPLA
ncbi:16S rRNA (guanine(527)-N(7))-methyltransferase RsmG [Collinsella vaginalis]|uniref:16S rRNA (guanine(527)-N(7))-methyltransferase RsmG n=1 Tax=Collinsella vaginalis TaxID=1870987 RepID=UPI000A269C54|nr:16S rRNA (guanine(527)-N(7))-methyltransferase RsmG [Collinsella vaginalis]